MGTKSKAVKSIFRFEEEHPRPPWAAKHVHYIMRVLWVDDMTGERLVSHDEVCVMEPIKLMEPDETARLQNLLFG